MKLAKSLLLGAAAGLATVAAASAADLPSRKSAPVEYVRVCNAYGAGFFYIPGTDTCLRVGGLVQADFRSYGVPQATAGGAGGANVYRRQGVSRDVFGSSALGRLELDARNQTGYGTLRTFLRIDAGYGTAAAAATGGLTQYNSGTNGGILPAASRDATIVNKAFIQFAGLTAGRAQSMYDFYADTYNLELLRGSNATTNLLAYTATFGGGFSATLSLEDSVARRAYIGSTRLPATLGPAPATVVGLTWAPYADVGGTRMPDIVANLRVDQGWGSVQLSGALHKVTAVEGAQGAPVTTNLVYPANIMSQDSRIGWAVQGGLKLNLPMLAAGDALYLQAGYAKGAVGYNNGVNLVYFEGINNTRHQGGGPLNALNGAAHALFLPMDCVFTSPGKCDLSTSLSVTAALKHYWTPTVSQSIYGSYYRHTQAAAVATAANNANAPQFRELRVGTNVMWTPVKGFDIGAELMYMRGQWNKFVVAGNPNPALNGRTSLSANTLESRVVVRRAF